MATSASNRDQRRIVTFGTLFVVCGVLAALLLYVAIEIVREYGEYPSATFFALPGLVAAAGAVFCVVKVVKISKGRS